MSFAKHWLNDISDSYFDGIGENGVNATSFIEKTEPVKEFISDDARSILSFGVGDGSEVIALLKHFSNKNIQIYGVDISRKSLDKTNEKLDSVNCNTVNLIHNPKGNFPTSLHQVRLDGIVFSSVLHEVYSYHANGRDHLRKLLIDSCKSLQIGGIIFIRDFCVPTQDREIELSFKTETAKSFYTYFQKYYRSFLNMDKDTRKMYFDISAHRFNFPPPNGDCVQIGLIAAAEMMCHFYYYLDQISRGGIKEFSPTWKELAETYFLPNLYNTVNYKPLYSLEYVENLKQVMSEALDSGEVILTEMNRVASRPNMAKCFSMHFEFSDEFHASSQIVFEQLSSKIELVFRKVKITY